MLDRDDGPAWDVDTFTISVPASVASTSVQVNSGPVRPDALLWQLVGLRVPLPA